MFILHFNRIIRNKWVWGVFAIAISIFFAFDFLFTGDGASAESARRGVAGELAGEKISAADFDDIATDIRGFGRARDLRTSSAVINRRAWETAAALNVAKNDGLEASDDEVRAVVMADRSFQDERGNFDIAIYQAILRNNDLSPERFEAYLKRLITVRKLSQSMLGSAAWVSPMELECAVNDMTDRYTVRVATFKDTAPKGSIKVNDAELRKYYAAHTNDIALPERVSVRYVVFRADAPARLASMVVSDDDLHDRYDATIERFETQTTNGVVRKTFEEAKPIILKELRLIASLEAYQTNLPFRVYGNSNDSEKQKGSRLDVIAAEDKLEVKMSPFFAASNRDAVPGFTVNPDTFAPGAAGFAAAAFELDPEASDLRYGVVQGTNAVYLIERAAYSKPHIPSFAEAKEVIRPAAVAEARAAAFKASVEKIRAGAAAGIVKNKAFDAKLFTGANVSTSITFSVSSLSNDAFPDASSVIATSMRLSVGQISDFVTTAEPDRGLLVYLSDRKAGDAAAAQMVAPQLRDELSNMAGGTIYAAWQKWNLARLGFKPEAVAGVTEVSDASAVSED